MLGIEESELEYGEHEEVALRVFSFLGFVELNTLLTFFCLWSWILIL
jgi:hypothetical protein